jgi:acyl-CoA thioesterase YciA|tara:strand:+ start:281 stop:673 length:393 start_codon:yes stop_codon:yes gene_type:complete
VELISTHFCKAANVGYHGNLFGGTMLAWLDEAGVSFACQVCDTPRMVTKKISEVVFHKPVRPGQIIKIYGEVKVIGNRSITIHLEARRHSVYSGSQKTVLTTDMTFVRIDGDGDAIPISQKVKDIHSPAT